ncbi:MAG TPA: hypothetical protein VKM93_06530 [Terriglobia bacterium]|nr:hypothetical protein [Terriglobia bacterium]
MAEENSVSITKLITVPALITLAITILRLVGELQGWSPLLFSTKAGGGFALVGISWLPIIFGPYFAVKLAKAGEGPASAGKAIGFAFLSLVVYILAGLWFGATEAHPTYLSLIPILLMLVSAFIPGIGWRSLGNTLVAYAFAARIPVLIVMFIAMRAGWETHYSRIAPMFANSGFAKQYLYEAFLPQMTMWIGWTAVVGSVFGTIVAAVVRPGKQPAPAIAN